MPAASNGADFDACLHCQVQNSVGNFSAACSEAMLQAAPIHTLIPLALCEYIISLTTFSEEAVVLDPFVGSGTTAVAAKRLQRRFIAIDINPEYVEITRKRLQQIEQRNESSTKYGKAHQLPLLAEGQRNGAKRNPRRRLQKS